MTACQANVDVPVLVGHHPVGGFHVLLPNHRAGLHRGVHLVSGAIEKAGVDEEHTVLGGADTFLQVDGGSPLLVHNADLERIAVESQRILDPHRATGR